MNLPPIHNTRSPKQWEAISKHVDFKGKTVLDLGCGYGDLLFRAREAGAVDCLGVDRLTAEKVYRLATDYLFENIGTADFDLDTELSSVPEHPVKERGKDKWDIIICFSVLPYLKQPFTVLQWIKDHSEITLIECQLAGDGPGFDILETDNDMRNLLLLTGWQEVQAIGKTDIIGRDRHRTIWMCR